MADVLSQSEVESLLAALTPEGASGEPEPAAELTGQPVTVYDFKRPERVSKEQMRVFHGLHETFSREFGAALSGMLRTIVEVKLIGVDQLTYSEFVFSLETPTCYNVIESSELDGQVILDLSPAIVFPVVDRLLGGGRGVQVTAPKRALTEIEKRLASRMTGLALKAMDNAWSNVCELNLTVAQVESNPQLVQIVPPNEVVVLTSFEITMGEVRGIMNFCLPYTTIEPLSGRLSSDTWANYTKRSMDPKQKVNLETSVSHAPVEMVTLLAETRLTAAEIRNLEVGDIVLTEHESSRNLKVLVEGRPLFEASPGVYRGNKAVRIRQKLQRARDLVSERLRAEMPDRAASTPSVSAAE